MGGCSADLVKELSDVTVWFGVRRLQRPGQQRCGRHWMNLLNRLRRWVRRTEAKTQGE